MKVILASNNKKKLIEMQSLLSSVGFDVISQRDAGFLFEVDEIGDTFQENAFLKASAVTKATGCIAIGDDSGLMVEALNGAPGVLSARITGNHDDTDEQKYKYLLKLLENTDNRTAKFVCSICCTFPNGGKIEVNGECFGKIAYKAAGNGGFGYDPVFIPDGFTNTMAELGNEVKNQISHRSRAISLLKKELEDYYAH